MIRKNVDIQKQTVPIFRGEIAEIATYDFFNEQDVNGLGRRFTKVIIPRDNLYKAHIHEGEMEAIYILNGQALVLDNNEEVLLEAGDCHICRDGETHAIKNAGKENLEYLSVVLFNK